MIQSSRGQNHQYTCCDNCTANHSIGPNFNPSIIKNDGLDDIPIPVRGLCKSEILESVTQVYLILLKIMIYGLI